MYSGLHGRVARLEKSCQPDIFAGMGEFRFADHVRRVPADTVIPEGGRIVQDFFEEFTAPDWHGRPGVILRSGYLVERVTADPDDQGRVLPIDEDPFYQEMMNAAPSVPNEGAPKPAAEEFVVPEDVMKLYR